MKKASHFATAVVLAAAVHPNPLFISLAGMTSSLPDAAERFLPRVKHRGATHILCLWLIVYAIAKIYGGLVIEGLALGALCHVLMDAFSFTGVPISPWRTDRLVIKAYATGTYHELIFLLMFFLFSGTFFLYSHPTFNSEIAQRMVGARRAYFERIFRIQKAKRTFAPTTRPQTLCTYRNRFAPIDRPCDMNNGIGLFTRN